MPVRPPQQPGPLCVELLPAGERPDAGGLWWGLPGRELACCCLLGRMAGAGIFPPLPAPSPTRSAAHPSGGPFPSFSSVAACPSVPRTLGSTADSPFPAALSVSGGSSLGEGWRKIDRSG